MRGHRKAQRHRKPCDHLGLARRLRLLQAFNHNTQAGGQSPSRVGLGTDLQGRKFHEQRRGADSESGDTAQDNFSIPG